jgi:hypothetical protein
MARPFFHKFALTAFVILLTACEARSPTQAVANSPASASATATAAAAQPAPAPVARARRNFAATGNIVPADSIESGSKVYSAVSLHSTKKDQYESTADYAKRMAALREQTMFDEVKLGGAFAFEVSKRAMFVRYNADLEQFEFEVTPTNDDLGQGFQLVELERRAVPIEPADADYFLKNHGKIVEAAQVTYARVPTLKGLTYPRATTKVARAEAREVELRLRVLLVGELQPPYTATGKKYPFQPDERLLEYRNIVEIKAPGFWLVDSRDANVQVLTKQFKFKRF